MVSVKNKVGDLLNAFPLDTCSIALLFSIHVYHICQWLWLQIWVGSKEGKIYIFSRESRRIDRELAGHQAPIRSMCSADGRYMMTGASSKDGRVAIWGTSMDNDIWGSVWGMATWQCEGLLWTTKSGGACEAWPRGNMEHFCEQWNLDSLHHRATVFGYSAWFNFMKNFFCWP